MGSRCSVAGGEPVHAGGHPPSAAEMDASARNSAVTKGSAAAADVPSSGLHALSGGNESDLSAANTTSAVHRRMSSEEFAASAARPLSEPATFVPVTKGKVSDATFGVSAEVLLARNRSQDDAGTMAQQLGLMQSSPLARAGADSPKGTGTRGGNGNHSAGSGEDGHKAEWISRQKLELARHTLDTAPGAQGVLRHKEWVTANGGRRGHKNVIESQPERIAGKKVQMEAPPEERRLDRLEARFLKETLAKHWLFEKFSGTEFAALVRNCEAHDLLKAQPLILQGTEDDGRMYIVHRGTLSVHVLDAKKLSLTSAQLASAKAEAPAGAAGARPEVGRAAAPTGAFAPPPSAPAAPKFDRGVHVATVLTGGWVGDMALLYKTTRTATVIAEADSRVLAVPRLAYENAIAEGYEAKSSAQEATNEFAQVPVFSGVSNSHALTQQARAVSWGAGEVLLESGGGAREMVLITQGEVDFESAGPDGALAAGAGGDYRWSLQPPFVSADRLGRGDVLAAGRPGDESVLVTLHGAGSARGPGAKLKLSGGLPRGASRAVAAGEGRGYRFYLSDIVSNPALVGGLVESLQGIRALLQCTPALAASLDAPACDAASFVMKPLRFAPGQAIPVGREPSGTGAGANGNGGGGASPLVILVSGKVGVRRDDDVSIRAEGERPSRPEPADGVRPAEDDGIVARLFDVLSTATPAGEPAVQFVAKSEVTVLAMARADYADLAGKRPGLAAVRTYPPQRPRTAVGALTAGVGALSLAGGYRGSGAGGGGGRPSGAGGAADAGGPLCGAELQLTDISFERKIGQGAYGAVYLVVHKPTGVTLAAKIIKLARLRKHLKDDAINVERHVMLDSRSPFLVRLCGTHKTNSHLLLMMEAGLGGELFSFLLRQEHQVLKEDSVRFYGACVLAGLAAMHVDGYMYRDLKPENVVITADGYCKIVDFGFAKRTAARTYTVCGTNAYLSPEMLTVQGHNFEVDYWALGVFLFEMAIGCASFNVEPDGTMNHEMPPFRVCQNILNPSYRLRFDIGVHRISTDLQDVISRLLEPRVEHRIGCGVRGPDELYEHPFFAPINFGKLQRFEYQPPWRPELQDGLDTRYFETTHKMRKSELVAFGIGDS